MLLYHHGVYAKSVRAPQREPQIPRIVHPLQQQQQRRLPQRPRRPTLLLLHVLAFICPSAGCLWALTYGSSLRPWRSWRLGGCLSRPVHQRQQLLRRQPRLRRANRHHAPVRGPMRQRVQLGRLDVPDRHPPFLRQPDHVRELLPVRIVPDQDHQKPPLIRPQRGQHRLSPFNVLHLHCFLAQLANCPPRVAA